MQSLCLPACADGGTESDGNWRTDHFTLTKEYQWELPFFASLTCSDRCAKGNGVRLKLVFKHHLHQSNCMLPVLPLVTSADCCIVTNCVQSASNFAFAQEVQRKFPTLALFASSHTCSVATYYGPNVFLAHDLH
eukprot:gnl/MRDRNA2_/MRDRNA2_476455_c0_seq1.p1 gnl/MRDRNA2_/MRDRNA2_476455_c0~~gnl/MRDRNA2_/MRDRNA2_476455_c0_seq1.p1  ORF type:complete len:134 (-),score=14.60 gnl/MRDRNA2_/MRDRNA2_476455_c0_seq1:124-525(-)